MASPQVWSDAKARIAAVAASLSLIVNYPNAESEEPELADDGTLPAWLACEIEGDGAFPLELGGTTWQEDGRIFVHVLSPTGSGIEAGLTIRQVIAGAFRVPSAVPGLAYDGFTFPPGGSDESSGNWFRLSLGISYRWTDKPTG